MNSPDFSSEQNSEQSSATSTSAERGAPIRARVAKVKGAVTSATNQAKDKVAEFAGEGKTVAADKVAGYSDRLREAARAAEEDQDSNIAHFAGRAADRLEQAANYVRDADFNRLRDDATQVARRHPALFMGGMLVAGMVLGNVAKASFQSLNEDDGDFGDEATDRDDGADLRGESGDTGTTDSGDGRAPGPETYDANTQL
jgi:hypothetical protein